MAEHVEPPSNKPSIAKRVLIAICVILVASFGIGAWYFSDYSHADAAALEAVADDDGAADGVVVRELSDKAIAFVPSKPIAGLVFYPGGKVQAESYAPLMTQCAQRGILCVLVRPPLNFPLFDVNAPDELRAQFPDVSTWLVGGHSLGGVAASAYLAGHKDDFADIVFLASYPAADLTGFEGGALSIIGTNDEVIDWKAYADAQSKLASNMQVEIPGGNHAHFGNYGEQAGDGIATITREEQQALTADAILELISAH